MPSAVRRRRRAPHAKPQGWHPGWLRVVPSELGEWLTFAVLRDPAAETPLRSLIESYELFAASEGLPAIADIAFVRHLEALGLERVGARFAGIRVHAAIPPLRLLTRLETYGFRFGFRVTPGESELGWRGPAAVSDLERRVIGRHHGELLAALRQIEETRAMLRGAHTPRPLPAGVSLRAA